MPDKASSGEIFEFLSKVSYYASGLGIFVPPPHTMTANNHKGQWYEDLPDRYQDNEGYYDVVLQQCFKSKQANLQGTEKVAHLVHKTSSMAIVYHLNMIAGHPALAYGTAGESLPSQKNDENLVEYLKRWLHYLHVNFLHGRFLSDRYFVETFAN